MLDSIKFSPLYPIANPSSIAFFGASNNPTSMGTRLLASVLELGFQGEVYPVHPHEERIQGLRAYKSVLDLPLIPDLAVLVLPTHLVPESVASCGRKGIQHAIVVSGGFKEVGGEGERLQEELVSAANRYGIRFLGPNCIGVANPLHRLNTTFFPFEGSPGFVGLASQSGSFVTQMFDYLSCHAMGFSTAFSVGNEANVDLVDCMEYLGACPHTRVIALYIESIRRGRAFVEASKSIAKKKPIVAHYTGGTIPGRRAALSHTGALGGPDTLYEGIFRQSGIIRARSVTEMFDICWVLGSLPKPTGRRVLVLTTSGGPGTEAADACGREGLELPPLSEETVKRLRPFVPQTGSIYNPVDLTFSKNPMYYFSDIPQVLLEEKKADILLIYLFAPLKQIEWAMKLLCVPQIKILPDASEVIDSQCNAIISLLETQNKPVVGFTYRSLNDQLVLRLMERGVPVFHGPQRAARAMAAACEYVRLRERLLASRV